MKDNHKYPILTLKDSLRTSFSPSFAPKSVLICVNPRQISVESAKSADIFMQNEPNFKKAENNVSPCMTKEYENFCDFRNGENEPKTKPNEPNSNPNQTQFEANSKPNKPNFLLIWVITY